MIFPSLPYSSCDPLIVAARAFSPSASSLFMRREKPFMSVNMTASRRLSRARSRVERTGRPLQHAPPAGGPDPREHLVAVERLRDVVVGPGVKADDAIDGVARAVRKTTAAGILQT